MSRKFHAIVLAVLLTLVWAPSSQAQNSISDIEEFVQQTPQVQVLYKSILPEVDGEIAGEGDKKHWVPVVNSDWDNNEHSEVARFNTAWNEEGLYVAAVVPGADPAVTMPTGRTPDAPFELLLNLDRRSQPAAGRPIEEGRYVLRFIPHVIEPSKMIYRSNAFQFNHRFGDNTRLTDPGLVIWKELSLSGIDPEGVETRWAHLDTQREEGMTIEIFIPWQSINVTDANPDEPVHFDLEMNLPESGRDSWTGRFNTLNHPNGKLRLLPQNENIDRENFLDHTLLLQSRGEVISDQNEIPVFYPYCRNENEQFMVRLMDADGSQVGEPVQMQVQNEEILQATLSSNEINDGCYRIQVIEEGTEDAIAEKKIYVAADRIAGLSERNEQLLSEIDSFRGNSENLIWQKGYLARAEYALEQSQADITTVEDLIHAEELVNLAEETWNEVSEGRRPATEEGYLHSAGFSADRQYGPVSVQTSDSDDTARLKIGAGNTEMWEVNPLIYGTFSEPVMFDRPIYDHLYAQRLRNPSFEWGHPTVNTTLDRYTRVYDEIDAEAAKQIREDEWVNILTTHEDEVAAPWFGIGSGNVSFGLHDKAYNTKKSQKITLYSDGFAGVAQVTDLPVWREQNYKFEAWLRTDDDAASATVKLYHEREVIDQHQFDNISGEWNSFTTEFSTPEVKERQNAFLISIELQDEGNLYVDQTTLYPEDHVNGMDPQALQQVKDLNTGWIRWPGGNFASAYNWEDGVGPKSERTSRINPSWIGMSPHFFGTDEYMEFTELANLEPLITVNAGDGTPEGAARWVEYANGSTDTPMGKLRAENGHPEPYDVKYWNIGNELWGHWQVGYCTPAEYARRYKEFVREMDKVDPSLEYVAIAWGPFSGGPPVWTDVLLEEVGSDLDIIDIHSYVTVPRSSDMTEQERVEALTAVPVAFEKGMMEIRSKMLDMNLKEVEIAIGEYNSSTWNIESKWRETVDLLSYGGWLHAFMRQGDYIMGANATEYSVFNPRSKEFDLMHPRYELFRIYRELAGSVPVKAELETPVRQSPYRMGMDITPIFNLPEVDAVVLQDSEDGSLGIGLMNRDLEGDITIEIDLEDYTPSEAVRYLFVDEDLEDHENTASVNQESISVSDNFTITLPARSVSLLKINQE